MASIESGTPMNIVGAFSAMSSNLPKLCQTLKSRQLLGRCLQKVWQSLAKSLVFSRKK